MVSRSGELATRALPAVLLDLHDELATGRLVLQRGRVSKMVDLVDGNPVSTASSPRDEMLGHFLVSGGVIDEDEHRRAVARANELGGKLGEALIALGILDEARLVAQLGKQARHKLVQALRWPQGAWRFEPAAAVDGIQIPMVDVVLTGLRETATPDLERLIRLDGCTFALTPRGEQLRHELQQRFGERAVAALFDGATMGELERWFPDRAQARIAIDTMMLCDAVEATQRREAVIQIPPKKPPVADPPPLPAIARAPTRPPRPGESLFDILFDDIGVDPEGSAPIELYDGLDDDSGVVSLADVLAATTSGVQSNRARDGVAAELQRIRGADHYAVLMIDRRAKPSEIVAAAAARLRALEDHDKLLVDPRDREKLDEVYRALRAARAVLLDDHSRAAYDRELAGGELVQVPPAFDTELSFRTAEELIARKQWTQAIGIIRTVITRSPGEADYHAALGWAEWKAGEETPEAADRARPHLNTALEINPDHAAAHDYKGRIDSALEVDDAEALFHLERALDIDPMRIDAVAAVEALLVARGDLRRYERTLKRVLFRLRGRGNAVEARTWVRLACLYIDHLDDPAAAAAAAANAKRILPRDPEVLAIDQRTQNSAHAAQPPRAGWREALGDPASGAALVKTTEASGHGDAAFLVTSTMVALGTADAQMAAAYEKRRLRTVAIPSRPLSRDQWAVLRHKDDNVELGSLIELIAPAVHAVAPMTLADSDLDPSQRIDDIDLPAGFLRLRQRCAEFLGVAVPPVYPRVELGPQVHVVACDPPVLVAGDEALTAPERPELVFRVVRAMTFLWPGRAVGASRPGRVLRAVVMAVFREASGSDIGIDDPLAEPAADAVSQLASAPRVQARAAALRMLSRGGGLNLSLWARSLSRTADRTAMLLCGDIPAAFTGAREVGELDRDLLEFAYSAAHVQLRAQLGLARG